METDKPNNPENQLDHPYSLEEHQDFFAKRLCFQSYGDCDSFWQTEVNAQVELANNIAEQLGFLSYLSCDQSTRTRIDCIASEACPDFF